MGSSAAKDVEDCLKDFDWVSIQVESGKGLGGRLREFVRRFRVSFHVLSRWNRFMRLACEGFGKGSGRRNGRGMILERSRVPTG